MLDGRTRVGTVSQDTGGYWGSHIHRSLLTQVQTWQCFFKWMDEGRFFSASFTYQDGELAEHSVVFHDNVG